jgi:hypothetical protein
LSAQLRQWLCWITRYRHHKSKVPNIGHVF